MRALIYFTDGTVKQAIVNSSYSRAGVHHYNLTLNALDTFLDFKAGITKTFTSEVDHITYVMS